jgi:hypothetical protein
VIRPQKPAKRNRTHHRSLPCETLSDEVYTRRLMQELYSSSRARHCHSGRTPRLWDARYRLRLLRCTDAARGMRNSDVRGAVVKTEPELMAIIVRWPCQCVAVIVVDVPDVRVPRLLPTARTPRGATPVMVKVALTLNLNDFLV